MDDFAFGLGSRIFRDEFRTLNSHDEKMTFLREHKVRVLQFEEVIKALIEDFCKYHIGSEDGNTTNLDTDIPKLRKKFPIEKKFNMMNNLINMAKKWKTEKVWMDKRLVERLFPIISNDRGHFPDLVSNRGQLEIDIPETSNDLDQLSNNLDLFSNLSGALDNTSAVIVTNPRQFLWVLASNLELYRPEGNNFDVDIDNNGANLNGGNGTNATATDYSRHILKVRREIRVCVHENCVRPGAAAAQNPHVQDLNDVDNDNENHNNEMQVFVIPKGSEFLLSPATVNMGDENKKRKFKMIVDEIKKNLHSYRKMCQDDVGNLIRQKVDRIRRHLNNANGPDNVNENDFHPDNNDQIQNLNTREILNSDKDLIDLKDLVLARIGIVTRNLLSYIVFTDYNLLEFTPEFRFSTSVQNESHTKGIWMSSLPLKSWNNDLKRYDFNGTILILDCEGNGNLGGEPIVERTLFSIAYAIVKNMTVRFNSPMLGRDDLETRFVHYSEYANRIMQYHHEVEPPAAAAVNEAQGQGQNQNRIRNLPDNRTINIVLKDVNAFETDEARINRYIDDPEFDIERSRADISSYNDVDSYINRYERFQEIRNLANQRDNNNYTSLRRLVESNRLNMDTIYLPQTPFEQEDRCHPRSDVLSNPWKLMKKNFNKTIYERYFTNIKRQLIERDGPYAIPGNIDALDGNANLPDQIQFIPIENGLEYANLIESLVRSVNQDPNTILNFGRTVATNPIRFRRCNNTCCRRRKCRIVPYSARQKNTFVSCCNAIFGLSNAGLAGTSGSAAPDLFYWGNSIAVNAGQNAAKATTSGWLSSLFYGSSAAAPVSTWGSCAATACGYASGGVACAFAGAAVVSITDRVNDMIGDNYFCPEGINLYCDRECCKKIERIRELESNSRVIRRWVDEDRVYQDHIDHEHNEELIQYISDTFNLSMEETRGLFWGPMTDDRIETLERERFTRLENEARANRMRQILNNNNENNDIDMINNNDNNNDIMNLINRPHVFQGGAEGREQRDHEEEPNPDDDDVSQAA